VHVFFEFNDRGRGPKVWTEITPGRDGIPTAVRNTGVDYLEAPVDEHFSMAGGKASWRNTAENGSKEAAGAFYVSMNGPSEETALLARALLAAGGRLPLLPEGEARLDKAGERRLEEGGRALTVTEYLISGLDFAPTPLWLDADGKFFAGGGSWLMVIRKGWESARPALIAAQREN